MPEGPRTDPWDRLSRALQRRPRARLFFTLSALWLVVTPGAVVILLWVPAEEGGGGWRLERVIAAGVITLHLLFLFLTWFFWSATPPEDPVA